MVTVTQSTPSLRTVVSKSGMVFPCTIDQQTDLNLGTTAISVYYKQSGCKASWDTAMLVTLAMQDSSAIIVQYVALDGEMTARCLFPNSVTLTKDNNLVARCYCTLRREWKTFRLDRMITCHALTMPDDVLCRDEAAA